jgi:hypothetical protein
MISFQSESQDALRCSKQVFDRSAILALIATEIDGGSFAERRTSWQKI